MKTELAARHVAKDENADDALQRLTIKEQVDNMGIALKNELLQLFEDDRRLKNIRFGEVYNLIESNKNLQTELINQQFESQKALVKAIINKEVAERTVGDEEIMTSVNRQINKINNSLQNNLNTMQERNQALEGKIDKTYEALTIKINNIQIRYDS